MGWKWLENTQAQANWRWVARVVVKAALLFAVLNVVFALVNPLPALGQVSIYNALVPGRERLPYGEDDRAYNLSLNNLSAMFASHTVSRPKARDEFRVFVMGDSSVWGVLLRPEDTLTGILNAADLTAPDGRQMRFYNLGHPIMSVTKDLMLLDAALLYEPDLIVWLTTLESLPRSEQLEPPLVQNNRERVLSLLAGYDLDLDPAPLVIEDFWSRTIIGARRDLADLLRLQTFGVSWATTGIDQFYPDEYDLRTSDFEEDESWKDFETPVEDNVLAGALAFDVIAAGHALAGNVPVLLVNEPIFISDGENSDLRYNLWYPRWAYDAYRDLYADLAAERGWQYLDVWDAVAPEEFTDSPVHLTPAGSQTLAEQVAAFIDEAL